MLLGSFLLSAISALAQGTVTFSVGNSKPIVNEPYSVVEQTEHAQTLADGTRMLTKTQKRLYRDSSGRTRTESFPNHSGIPSRELTVIEIHDPVAGKAYRLFAQTRVAQLMAPPQKFLANPNVAQRPVPPSEGMHPVSMSEQLESQMIEGISTDHVRTTTTFPEGMLGNDRPIQLIHERWISIELGLTLQEKTSDPRFGETVMRVTSLDRSEPDPSLFQVPPDYVVEDSSAR
jgi:hypothetical protein